MLALKKKHLHLIVRIKTLLKKNDEDKNIPKEPISHNEKNNSKVKKSNKKLMLKEDEDNFEANEDETIEEAKVEQKINIDFWWNED